MRSYIRLKGGSRDGETVWGDPRPGFIKLAKRIDSANFDPSIVIAENTAVEVETYITSEVWEGKHFSDWQGVYQK